MCIIINFSEIVIESIDESISLIIYVFTLSAFNPSLSFTKRFPYFTNKGQMSSKIEKLIKSKTAQTKLQRGWELLKQIKLILDKVLIYIF